MKCFLLLLICSCLSFAQPTNRENVKDRFGSNINNSYTEKAEIDGSIFYYQSKLDQITVAGNVSNVFSGKVRSFTTVTEEEDPNKGRIWLIVGAENSDPSLPDLIYLYYSDDNGASWIVFANGILSVNQHLFPDQIDAEIAGNTIDPSQHKYLFVAYTYATGNYISGPKRTGLLVADITQAVGGLFSVNFPGGPNNQYYDLRITSDIEKYSSDPWIYLVSTIDSTLPSGDIVCMQRIASIQNPFTFLSNPNIIYRTEILQQYVTVSGATTTKGRSDIVFLPVPEDKVYYTLSHPNSDGIWINNTDIYSLIPRNRLYMLISGYQSPIIKWPLHQMQMLPRSCF
ncbi:MAG TPA: hypothetical protein VI362_07615 [Ignavibacteriaceae bacterium]|nr:hypothetical protein [Ignavibacteriaceae bacterium]